MNRTLVTCGTITKAPTGQRRETECREGIMEEIMDEYFPDLAGNIKQNQETE